MTKPSATKNKPRKQHSPAFRDEALKLAQRIGVAAATRELCLYKSQLYTWRSKQQQSLSASEREQELATENAQLKRQLAEQAEQAEELAIFQNDRDILRKAPEMKYVFIEKHQAEFSIKAMCRVLRVARSGWHAWRRRRQGLRAKASRRFRPVSYREHGLPVSENPLKQDFTACGPNQKWAGDITYLPGSP